MRRFLALSLLFPFFLVANGCDDEPADGADAGADASPPMHDGAVVPPADAGDGGDGATDDGGADPGTDGYPSEPPAEICGDTDLLSGPSTAPADAIEVSTSDDLGEMVDDAPPGTTFWLAPGTHTLPLGEYSQVIPKDGDVFIGAPGAILDGQHSNLYAFTQHATNVTIRYLTIQNFGSPGDTNNEGVVNHDAGEGWTVEYSTIQNNAGAGLFIGTGSTIRYNCLKDNGQYGFSAYSPSGISDVVLDHNEIVGNNTDDWETRSPGCGCTGGGKFWATTHATITNNYVHGNHGPGLWADTNNVDFTIEHNYIAENDGVGFFYEISYNATVRNNTFRRNALVEGPTNPGFPTGAIYLSEAGGDPRVEGTGTIDIEGNLFEDNWSGVVLWENADRFCNSPANTSSGTCTLVGEATTRTCVAGTIEDEPYFSDCRWKTQNVSVHDNVFRLRPDEIADCDPSASCGMQGLFSNWGTYPDWSPYMETTVEENIAFHQNNVFSHNTYEGPWQFMVYDQGTVVDTADWRAEPYHQDDGSTFE
jgi:hypothetical protein